MDHGQQITEAVSIPVIGDADDGFGNEMNLKRTVMGYIRAGYTRIMLDDQVELFALLTIYNPKSHITLLAIMLHVSYKICVGRSL